MRGNFRIGIGRNSTISEARSAITVTGPLFSNGTGVAARFYFYRHALRKNLNQFPCIIFSISLAE